MIEVIGALGPQYIDYTTSIKATSDSLQLEERAGSVYDVFKQEISDATTKERATASMIIGAFALEQGPINEFASVLVTTAVLNTTGNPVMSGVIGGLSYAAQQGIYGLLTSKGTEAIPKTEEEYHKQFPSDMDKSVATTLWRKYKVLFLLGMSALVVNEHMQQEDQDFKKDAKLVRNWMPALIATDLAVFYAGSYIIDNAEKVGLDPNTIVDAATNPFTYIALFGLSKYSEHYRKYKNNLSSTEVSETEKPTFLEKVKTRFAALRRNKTIDTAEDSVTIVVDESN